MDTRRGLLLRLEPGRTGIRARLRMATVVAAMALLLRFVLQVPAAEAKSVTTTHLGLDRCDAPSVSNMQTWWDNGIYWWANIYFGGDARGCPNQTYLNSAWVVSVLNQGWKLLPTWVGFQAPCTGYAHRMSWDPGTAYNQGHDEAQAAVAGIRALGMEFDTPIAYDMEDFPQTSDCISVVQSFIDGWTHTLAIPPRQLSGVYGSGCASAIDAYAFISRPPDFIWAGDWGNGQDTSNISCVGASHWTSSQRHKQYLGEHQETFGGVTLSIDSDSSNGPVYQHK